jgi:hypothetical protein
MRLDARPNATGIAPRRFQGKGMIFKIGNRKCKATMINMETNRHVGGRLFLRLMVASFPSFPVLGARQIINRLGSPSVKAFSTHLVHVFILYFQELDLCLLRHANSE